LRKLRFEKKDEARIDHDMDALVVPMAQRDVIDLFYGGIWPELKPKLAEIAQSCILGNVSSAKARGLLQTQLKGFEQSFEKALSAEVQENYTSSLINAVAGLPRQELAGLAEALVSITAFVAKMSTGRRETVGGPIDVALISKGDGFVWIKRKDRMQELGIG
jgi:hypothetical protein